MPSRWSLRELLNKADDRGCKRVAGQGETSSDGIIEAGKFRIDLTRQIVCLRGRALELTCEEFEVLVFLARHPQSLITPRTMLSTSWTDRRVRQTDFLRALVSLRNKLEAVDPGNHYLRTEPLIVYRFDATSLATA